MFVITFDRYDQYGNARRKGHNDLRLVVLPLLFWSPEGNNNCAFTLSFLTNCYTDRCASRILIIKFI